MCVSIVTRAVRVLVVWSPHASHSDVCINVMSSHYHDNIWHFFTTVLCHVIKFYIYNIIALGKHIDVKYCMHSANWTIVVRIFHANFNMKVFCSRLFSIYDISVCQLASCTYALAVAKVFHGWLYEELFRRWQAWAVPSLLLCDAYVSSCGVWLQILSAVLINATAFSPFM